MKDNFSERSALYSQFRPDYPTALIDFICSEVPGFSRAWDCGTGNGQLARHLSEHFIQVFATDISARQLGNAVAADNISYSVQPAEQTTFADDQFDLIAVAQAVHWFDFEKFYAEAVRTAKNNALIALIGYNRPRIDGNIDELTDDFYFSTVGPYWDAERKYVDENYKTIPFPFTEITSPEFAHELSWSAEQLLGYFSTWSAVKHYTKQNNTDPVSKIREKLLRIWPEQELKTARFPIITRMGRISK